MKIRHRICTLTLGVMSLTAYAQNTQQINVSPYIDETSEIPASVEKVVYGKLGSIITSYGQRNRLYKTVESRKDVETFVY